jgi:O-antigen ligase
MMYTIKELVVVLGISWAVFRFMRPIALLFGGENDFSRRRNTWYAVTVAAFLSPTFFVFCLACVPFLVWAGRKDSNPGALYLLLMYVVPEFSWRVPMVGVSYLMDLDFLLLLSFCVMAPAALRLLKAKKERSLRPFGMIDFCLLAFLVLTSLYFVLPEISHGVLMTPTFTDCLRRAFEAFFGIYVPYFVISRWSSSRREIQEMLAFFCVACAVMAAIATFEAAKHWLLYAEIRPVWYAAVGLQSGPELISSYLLRGQSVRAMASSGHPLVLGYLLAVGLGFWLSIKSQIPSTLKRNAVIVLFLLGLLAAYSRGPWAGAVIIYFVYVALSGRAVSKLLKAIGAAAIVGVIVALSPLGARIAQVIPFLGGSVGEENITYRERLWARAWELIQQSPFLGDQQALLKMEDLRQGEGIIDLMNGFANVLLDNGFLGLFLFLAFVLFGVLRAWMLSKESARVGPELAAIGAALVACILGTLLMIWFGGLIVSTTCVLVALAGSSAYLGQIQQRSAIRGAPRPRTV